MTAAIFYSDAIGLAELIRNREISPVEVVQAYLDRIEAVNPKINAIVLVAEGALEAARAAEAAVLAGDKLGPLHGVPFTVKDSIDTAGVLTQRGSPIFRGRIPDTDATSVARMKKAGGILLAKTNLPEFSYWIESDNLLSGRSNNPWDVSRTPGGSGGGESAAIAAGMSPIGLGTDLAISVRGPAAQTGITSMKATHGRVPMTGIWPRAPRRFWHVGPMARSVRDIALAFSQLVGPSYPTELPLLAKLLPNIETPVQIITGDHDTGVLPVNGDYLHERLPHSKSDKLDAGHFPWADAADQYATLIIDWWNGGYQRV